MPWSRASHEALPGELVGDEPVSEGGIVDVDAYGSAGRVHVRPVPFGDGWGFPTVVALLTDFQHCKSPPRGHRWRKIRDQRVDFWLDIPCQIGSSPAENLILLLQQTVPLLQFPNLG